MNKHLKFRRLIGESLERRQLFAADVMFSFDSWIFSGSGSQRITAHGDYGQQSESISREKDCDVDSGTATGESDLHGSSRNRSSQAVTGMASFRDRTLTGHRGGDRLSGEGEFDRVPPTQSRPGESSRGSPSIVKDSFSVPTTGSELGFALRPNFAGASPSSISPQTSKSSEPSPSIQVRPVASANGSSPTSTSNTSNSSRTSGSFEQGVNLGAQPSGTVSSLIIIQFQSNNNVSLSSRPSSSVNSAPTSNTLQQLSTPTANSRLSGSPEAVNPGVADRNSSSTIQTIQQQHAGNIRSLQNFLDASTDTSKSTRLSGLMSGSSNELGVQPSNHTQGITSRLEQGSNSQSISRVGSKGSSHDQLFEDDLLGDSVFGNRLGSVQRPWKISEQALSNLRKLSKSADTLTSESATSSDKVIASWFEEGGFSEIEYRRNPITRLEQPWDAVQVTTRLESKVGMFRVFDVIDEDRAGVANSGRLLKQVVLSPTEGPEGQSPSLDLVTSTPESELPVQGSFSKPLFLTTMLAVFSGRLLRSRRKQSEKDLPSGHDVTG